MKRTLQIIVSAAATSVLAFSALSQDKSTPLTDRPHPTLDRLPQARNADRLNGAAKASEVIGMTVKNDQDEKLGKVEDLGVDVQSGRLLFVILSTGGFIGIGDTLTAVPPGALRHDAGQKVLHLDADKEKLKSAPAFEMSKWAEASDSNHLSAVYRYFGEEPAFRFIQRGDVREDRSMIPPSRLSRLQKASKVMGTPVKNLQDEKLGKVENLLVDLPSGRLVAVVVSSGGFLGIGDELSAVPPPALKYTSDRDILLLDASKEMLSNAPHFKASQWPDFAEPSYADGVYRAYRVEPYFTTNATTAADSLARNVRDREDRTLTPLDQGNNKTDVATTAQIRKEIIATKDMSVNAKNVKIITLDGHVTLRGAVNTEDEKRVIGEIAERIVRSENVDNQLEVKLSTSSVN